MRSIAEEAIEFVEKRFCKRYSTLGDAFKNEIKEEELVGKDLREGVRMDAQGVNKEC